MEYNRVLEEMGQKSLDFLQSLTLSLEKEKDRKYYSREMEEMEEEEGFCTNLKRQ